MPDEKSARPPRITAMRILLLALAALATPLHASEPTPIFDGKSLAGWTADGEASYWTAADGVLTGKSDARKKESNLWTERKFTDFVLEAEFRFAGRTDSGFFLRNKSEQIQIGVSGSLKRDMTCSPYIGEKRGYPVSAVGVDLLLKESEWNQIKIEVRGKKYKVTLNGKQVLEYTTDAEPVPGPIGLQVHGGLEMQIDFRNLKVAEIAQ
jgi:hypothetical protein